MAVIQISKIQVRRGLQENLPQLASGEFGWSVDTRRLYIGNGTLVEGAPELGVTEIFTEHSSVSQATDISELQANVANLQANVTSIEYTLSFLSPVNFTLTDNTSSPKPIGLSANLSIPHILDYTITRGSNTRAGTITASVVGGNIWFDDSYSENANLGVILTYINNLSDVCPAYVTTSTGTNANLSLYVRNSFL